MTLGWGGFIPKAPWVCHLHVSAIHVALFQAVGLHVACGVGIRLHVSLY